MLPAHLTRRGVVVTVAGTRRSFGEIEARRSTKNGKTIAWRARYHGPDGKRYPRQFGDRLAAEVWLVEERKLIDRGEWTPPEQRAVAMERLTLTEWAESYIESRTLAPSTYRNYTRNVRVHIAPTLGRKLLDEITATDVATWHARIKKTLRQRAADAGRTNGDGGGEAAQVYKFLSSVLRAAVAAGLIDVSPARVSGGGSYRRKRQPQVLTTAEVGALAVALPPRYRALADLLSGTGLRIGEARALRRRDLDLRTLKAASVSVQQNVSQGGKGVGAVVGPTKTEASHRTVAISAQLAAILRAHVKEHAQPGRDGYVFPSATGRLLSDSTWRYAWARARAKAGLDDVHTHDLRHTSLTLAARAGATTAELMHRAGHSEPRVAMIYQHASAERDRMIAERMAAVARGDELAERRARKARGANPAAAIGGP